MNRSVKYDFILEKLEQYSVVDSSALWKNISETLDQEMPEDKDRKRFGWLFTLNGFFTIITLSFLSVLAICIWTKPKPGNTKQIVTDYTLITSSQKVSTLFSSVSTTRPNTKSATQEKNTSDSPANIQQQENLDLPSENQSIEKIIGRQNTNLAVQNADKTRVNKTELILANENKKILPTTLVRQDNALIIENTEAAESSFGTVAKELNVGLKKRTDFIANEKNIRLFSISADATAGERKDVVGPIFTKKQGPQKGFTAGVSLNYNVPVSKQEISTVSINGKSSSLIDYLPSLYLQYHFNNKLLVESELQFISPQYTPELKLFSHSYDYTATAYKEHAVALNKLYYLNLPLSVSYTVLPNLSIGAGLQYSYLKRSVLAEEECQWQKNGNDWVMISETKTIAVKSNPQKESKGNSGNSNSNNSNGNGNNGNGSGNGNNGNGNGNGNNGNGNGNGNGGGGNSGGSGTSGGGGTTGGGTTSTATAVLTSTDTVARSFRSSDWRMLFNANYSWKRLNVGLRFSRGLDNYIHTQVTGYNSTTDVKDRNESFQLYLRYNLLDLRRKKK